MIKVILARSSNHVIGINNTLPWRLLKDLEMFKQKTLGCGVLMGRKTYESLPPNVRPLPGRINYVVSSDISFRPEGVIVVDKPMEFLISKFINKFNVGIEQKQSKVLWVIGGLQIYNLALQYADEIHLTEIMKDFEGDTYSPPIDLNTFILTNSSEVFHDTYSGLDFFVTIYKRRSTINSL